MQIKNAAFGDLFKVGFAVGAAFQAVLIILGLIAALLNPSLFHSGSPGAQVAASSPVQAVGILVFMAVVMLVLNLTISAGGAAILTLTRFLPNAKASKAVAES